MKKLMKCILCLGLMIGTVGCSNKDNDINKVESDSNVSSNEEKNKDENIIIADNGVEIDLKMYEKDEDFMNYEFEEEEDGSITLRRYNGNVQYLILPEEYDGKKIVNIKGAFYDSNIKGIIIPEGYLNISHNAFNKCNNLETVIMPDSVVSLTDYRKDINGNIDMANSDIDGHIFDKCSKLENIRLSRNIKDITSKTFVYCYNLKKIIIPASVEVVQTDSFWCCENLETVVYEEGTKEINANAFYYSKKLYNIYIPATVTSIKGEFSPIHPNAIFHVEEGSYAEQYAKDNGFKIEYN